MLLSLEPRGQQSRPMLWLSPLLAAVLTLLSGVLLFTLLGSALIGAGLKLDSIFYVLAALGIVGAGLTLLVPMARAQSEPSAARREAARGQATSLRRAA